MARLPKRGSRPAVIDLTAEQPAVIEPLAPEATVLAVLDRLVEKGSLLEGELTLGVAGVDLICLRLSALLCAADRVLTAKR
jgi:Gas vesicle protein